MSPRTAIAFALSMALGAGIGRAQEAPAGAAARDPRWWGSLGAGAARLSGSEAPLDDERSGWRLEFFGGVKATPAFWLGLKLGGVSLEAGNLNDPSEGEAVSEVFALAEYHPGGRHGFFAGVGAGWSSYANGDAAWFDREGDGWGAEISAGYLWPVARRWGVASVLSYSAGRIAARSEALPDLDYDALALSVRLLAY
jgi:hypothetical protein